MNELHCKFVGMIKAEKFKLIENNTKLLNLESLNYSLEYNKESENFLLINKNSNKINKIQLSPNLIKQIKSFPIKIIQFSLF